MTKDEINRAIAEKVMGWILAPMTQSDQGPYAYYIVDSFMEFYGDWNPYEHIDHAWMVIDSFEEFSVLKMDNKYKARVGKVYGETADTASAAICLAALKTLKEKP